MKKTLLASIALCCLPALVFAAQTPVTPMGAFPNPATASINTLKAATNTKLEVIEANRQDHVSVLAAKADKSSTIVEWSAWPDGTQFSANAIVSYQGSLYKCLQPYTKNSGDTPAAFTAYWSVTGVTSYAALTDKPTIPDSLSDLSADTTHRVVTDAEKTTWNGKANTSSFASSSAFQAAFGWSPSGTFDTTADQTITGDWAFSSGLEASNISLNLGSLADLKIGNAQMVDDTKGNGDTNYLWSADKVFDQLATKQSTLVSGDTVKTINGSSLLGSGDLTVSGGSGTSGYVSLSAAPYSDVACTTGQYGYYGSTAYLCTGGYWTSKWTISTHTNLSPSSCSGLFRSGSTESFESGSGTFCTTDAWSETDTINAIDTYSTTYHNCGIHSASIIIDADNASAPLLTANLGSGQTDFYHRFYFYVPSGIDQSFTLARYAEAADGSNYSLSVKATYDGVNSWIVRARVDGVDTDESFSLPQGAGYRMEAHVVRGAGTNIKFYTAAGNQIATSNGGTDYDIGVTGGAYPAQYIIHGLGATSSTPVTVSFDDEAISTSNYLGGAICN